MAKRATIRDIAKNAGVSVASVSNVINGVDKVSEETRERIFQVMREMDYQPNLVARSLSKRQSDMLGLLLPITAEGPASTSLLLRDNPFYGELLSGVEYQASALGYDVLIKGIRPGESCRDWVLKRNLDGAIFIGNYSELISEEMRSLGRRLVLVDCYDEGTQVHSTLCIDDEKGGYLATRHLLEHGHRRIALAASNIQVDGPIRRRYLGYKRAMTEAGITEFQDLIFQNALSYDGGYQTGRLLLKRPDITAVFAVGDVMAFGILKVMYEARKRVPEELSIVGFDNTKSCEYSMPALTSVNQSVYDRGRFAVEALVAAIREDGSKLTHTNLPVSLVTRKSVAFLGGRKDGADEPNGDLSQDILGI